MTTIKLSGITITECYADVFAFCEDKDGNLGDNPTAEDLAEYDLPERLVDMLDAHCNADKAATITLDMPDDLLAELASTLDHRIDIFDDNHNYNRTDGKGSGHSAGRGDDAEAAKFFATSLRKMRRDARTLAKLIESPCNSSAAPLVAGSADLTLPPAVCTIGIP